MPHARALCTEYARLSAEVDALHGLQSGHIRIGTFSSVATHWLPYILHAFSHDYPGIDYELLLGDYCEVEDWLTSGWVDCGFVRLPTRPEFTTIFLQRDDLAAVLPADHPLAAGETAAQALARTLTLAQHAEAWGYHRFWVAEHHNTDQLASPSPELVIAWLLGHTRRIRLGSGGVMLQHYSPYKVAENFNLLAALAPGRIDLGVGKAPGGLPLSTRALQQGLHQEEKGTFADQLAQLDNWLSLTEPGGEESLRATPIPPRRADGFLLGASLESAELAARLDWNFVFAAHLNGDSALRRAVFNRWRELSPREAMVAVQVVVADDSATAAALAQQVEVWRVELENGQRVTVGSEAQAVAFARQAGSRPTRIARRESSLISGTPEQVKARLDALQAEEQLDELIIDTPISDGPARLHSLRLLAQAHYGKEVLNVL